MVLCRVLLLQRLLIIKSDSLHIIYWKALKPHCGISASCHSKIAICRKSSRSAEDWTTHQDLQREASFLTTWQAEGFEDWPKVVF